MLLILLSTDKANGLEPKTLISSDSTSESRKDCRLHIIRAILQASLFYSHKRVLHQPLTLSFAPIENELSGISYSPQLGFYECICCHIWLNARLSHQVYLHLQESLIVEHKLLKMIR